MKSASLSLITGIAAISINVAAATLHVPGQYPTIQQAIDAASDGDTVSVAAGTYAEGIVVTRAVSVVGAGRNVTFLGQGGDAAKLSANGSSLSGFTIAGQVTAYCAKATIEKNTIRAAGGWTGIYAYTYPYYREDCHGSADAIIQNNLVTGSYQGVAVFLANPVIRNNVIVKNIQAGIMSAYAFPTIVNNTIANNGEAGVMNWAYAAPTIRNNIIAHNGRFGVLNSYNSWSVSPAFNVFHENQVANYASIWDGAPITPSGTEILGNPALANVPRWTSSYSGTLMYGYVAVSQTVMGEQGPGSMGPFQLGNFIQIGDDTTPRVISSIVNNQLFFQPDAAAIPLLSPIEYAGYFGIVSYLGHNRDIRFDWRINSGSVAINACDPDPTYADRDGSRNDCGASGGPWAAP